MFDSDPTFLDHWYRKVESERRRHRRAMHLLNQSLYRVLGPQTASELHQSPDTTPNLPDFADPPPTS